MKYLYVVILSLAILISCKEGTPKLTADEIDAQIKTLTEEIKSSEDVSDEKIVEIVNMYDQYATQFPESESAPFYLEKQAQYLSMLGQMDEALAVYEKICNDYKDADNRAPSMFMLAFIYAENKKDKEKAREYYELFLVEYPTHELAKDAQFSLETLYMTDEELLEYIINQNAMSDSTIVL